MMNNLLLAAAGAGGLAAAYFAGRYVYDDVTLRACERRLFRAKLDAYQQREAIKSLKHIPADERGRLGVMVRPDGTILNADTHALFNDQWRVAYVDPVLERLDRVDRRILALSQGSARGSEAESEILADPSAPQLPTHISLQDALGMRTPSLDSLLVGVTLDDHGQIVPLNRSIYQLMHLLSIGRTGSGKSTWLLAFLAQLQMCREDIEVVLIDVHGAAFNICQDWSRLRYPIARNNQQAKLVLEQVIQESERRAELFPQVSMAEDLDSYNANVEPEQRLIPWVTVIDEGTMMLADSSIASFVASSVQGTRQYGMYVFMTGQTGNTTVIKSPIRANFPTRVCYSTEKPSMVAALGESPPKDLPDIPGRGWARLKNRRMPYEIQAPYIRRGDFYNLIEHEGPRFSMPEGEEEEAGWTDEHLRNVWEGLPRKNKSALCRALGEETGGAGWGKVNEAGRRAGLWD